MMHKASLLMLLMLGGCSSEDTNCLPENETGTVIKNGVENGQRIVLIQRTNGQKIKCAGRTTPIVLQYGDKVDGVGMDLIEIVEE